MKRMKWGDYLFGVLVMEICHKVNPDFNVPGWWLVVLLVLTLWMWSRE